MEAEPITRIKKKLEGLAAEAWSCEQTAAELGDPNLAATFGVQKRAYERSLRLIAEEVERAPTPPGSE